MLTFNGIEINTDPPVETELVTYRYEGSFGRIYGIMMSPADAAHVREQGWFMLYDRKCTVLMHDGHPKPLE